MVRQFIRWQFLLTAVSNPTRPSDAIPLALAERYRNSVKALNEYRDDMFPKGEKVHVDTDRYRGPGIASRDSGCPPDQLPVLLENGNTWWYPIERCWPVSNPA